MRYFLAMAAAVLFLFGVVALAKGAPIQLVALVDRSALVPVSQAQRAAPVLQRQINRDFRRYWRVPKVVVVVTSDPPPGAWPIYMLSGPPPVSCDCWGFHMWASDPWMVVWVPPVDSVAWTVMADHELMETLVDPHSGHPEVCDPVNNDSYEPRGALFDMSDFTLPAFWNDRGGRTDYLGFLKGVNQESYSGSDGSIYQPSRRF